LTQHPQPSEQALENAVSRALRDNLIPLQRTADELQQAYADLVAACSSSRPSNALPAMLRAQTAASSLAAGLSVLSNFLAVAFNPNYQHAWDVQPAPGLPETLAAVVQSSLVALEEKPAGPAFAHTAVTPAVDVPAAVVADEYEVSTSEPHAAEVPDEVRAEVHDEVRAEVRDDVHPEVPAEAAPEATVMHPPDVVHAEDMLHANDASPAFDYSTPPPPQEAPALDSTPILAAEEILYDTPPPPPSPDLRIPDSPFPARSVEEAIEASLQFSSAAPAPPASPESPAFDISTLPPDLQDLHRRANRVAKVAMQDIKLLRPKDVRLGRENKDLCQRLRSDLDKARKEYDRRCHAILDHPVDYFHRWAVEILAEGEEESLGEYPYPSPVLRH
jgi:hypothetical protein